MKYLFILFLLISSGAHAQLTDKQLKEMHDNTAKIESTTVKLNESIKNSMHAIDSLNMVEFNKQNERNLNAFMAARKEQERKNMQRMYWRLGLGILMFIVLIVGWSRKKKMAAKVK
jgi:methionine-rich copper-binding protein CopC